MTGNSVLLRRILLSAVALGCAAATHAQTPLLSGGALRQRRAQNGNNDYVKRVEMIPMRDGVKLYTVIVIPKGAKKCRPSFLRVIPL